jgi:hypothetical protein
MRGRFQDQGGLFSYIRPEERIPADHPLREIRKLVREVLKELSHSFGKLYSQEGRPSIPPEQLLNRNGLAVDGTVTQASGTAERRASEAMLKKKTKRSGRRITVGEDKAYDTSDHVAALREMNITPHVAQNDSLTKAGKHRSSAVDGRTTRHIGYSISQSCRAMSECIFGWGKQHGTMRKTKHRGIAVVGADFLVNLIVYNLVRIPKLIAA